MKKKKEQKDVKQQFLNGIKQEIKQRQQNRKSILKDIQYIQMEMEEQMLMLHDNNNVLQPLMDFEKNFAQQFDEEYAKLKELPFLEDFKVNDSKLELSFKPVIIKYRNKDYNLGKYKAIIGSNISFKQGSKTGVIHPHIMGNVPCFGTFYEEIFTLKGQGRLVDLAIMLNAYLHTYNSKGSYSNLEELWGGNKHGPV